MAEEFSKKKRDDVFTMIFNATADQQVSVGVTGQTAEKEWDFEHQEGKLSIDVAQTKKDILIVCTMAGAQADKIDVSLHNDLLTIRGTRRTPLDSRDSVEYVYQECFWGDFSRTVVLPSEVKAEAAKAEYKNGVLRITVPKREAKKHVPVVIVDE